MVLARPWAGVLGRSLGRLRAGAPGLEVSPVPWAVPGRWPSLQQFLCFPAFLFSRHCRFPAARPWLTEDLSVSPQDMGRRTARRPRGSPAAPDPPVPSPSACPPDSSEPSEGWLLVVVASVLSKNSPGQGAVLAPCAPPPVTCGCVPQGPSSPPCFSH